MITAAFAALLFLSSSPSVKAQAIAQPTCGQLTIEDRDHKPIGICPLERTSVTADLAGFGVRVTVVQTFDNPSNGPIEAVYTFPLPDDAAVDRMQMKIGDRVIEGVIKRRDEARRIYESAKSQGQTAALLDQERPNIFTQSVANIMPGAKVRVQISYVQVLKYEEGQFEFNFPMVVGPRYTTHTPDAGTISPPITPKGTRTGTNIDLTVNVDAGAPIREIKSVLHEVHVQRDRGNTARVTLAKLDEIPNRDFILRYGVASNDIQSAFLTHMDGQNGGFFTLMLMPPKAPSVQQIRPRELIFVLDQSGSQAGFPIAKSKELTRKLIHTMRAGDTFNVMGFNTRVNWLWSSPRAATEANVAEAETWLKPIEGDGGTELYQAVQAALGAPNDPKRVRLVVFNTDGFVGNEKDILTGIRQYRGNARMFTFGIGNSVNRYLIDAMSVEGKGDAEYVTLAEQADSAAARFVKRTQTPVLTNVTAQFDGVTVTDVMPSQIPDVFDEKPVVLYGRFSQSGQGRVTLRGMLGDQAWSQTIDLNFGASSNAPAVETLWARNKIDDLGRQQSVAAFTGEGPNPTQNEITDTALLFGIMSEFTSFVAVEPRVINIGGHQRRVRVPVEMADGVSYDGIFGDKSEAGQSVRLTGGQGLTPLVGGGHGGGGFRGGAGGGPVSRKRGGASSQAAAKAAPSTQRLLRGGSGGGSLGYVAADSADYGLLEEGKLLPPEERRKLYFEHKVAKPLRSAKGAVEVQLWLANLDAATLKKLADLGLVVADTDRRLKIVFGTCDAKGLIELAQLDAVQRIEKLGD